MSIRKQLLRPFFLCLLSLCSFASSVSAKHLLGGELTYRFLGLNGGYYHYEVTITMYRDCNTNSPLDNEVLVGVYEKTPGTIVRTDSMFIPLTSHSIVSPPPAGKNCKVTPPDICIEKGIYKSDIFLPPSSYGYYLEFIRCCRNNAIANTRQNEGQTYFGFIPPTAYENTSPVFDTIPLAYANAGYTLQIPFGAKDANGDSLYYQLAWPYQGGDSSQNGAIPDVPYIFQHPRNIDYNPGFSYKFPFGSKGTISIDSKTGLLSIDAPNAGYYVIAVNVIEYRKGVALDTVRRDVQLLIVNGPVNPPPKRDTLAKGGTGVLYYIDAGEQLDMYLHYSDPTDSLKMVAAGELVDGSIKFANKPFFTGTVKGFKNIYPHLVWKTTCADGRASQYHMQLIVTDNGCPAAATYYEDFFIQVIPPLVSAIAGPSNLCQTDTPIRYTAKRSPGNILTWLVSGGTMTVIDSNSIKVVWQGLGKRTIKVIPSNKAGCVGDTAKINVNILQRPQAPSISGPVKGCMGKTYTYFVPPDSTVKYLWIVTGGKQMSGHDSNKITVVFNRASDTDYVKVVALDVFGCGSDTYRLAVSIGNPSLDSIYGSVSVCPNSSGIDYWVNGEKGASYYWSVTGGQQVAGGNTSHIKIDWGEKGGGTVSVVQVTSQGCTGDTVKLTVLKDYVLYTSPIRGDSMVCEYTSGKVYEVTYSNGSTYDWQIVGGTIISGNGSARIIVDWDKAGMGALTVKETAFDPVNKKPCIGLPVTLIVRLSPLPHTSNILGPQNICEGDVVEYKVQGYADSRFIWHVRGIADSTNFSDSIFYKAPLLKNSFDTFHLDVTEITADSCVGETRFLTVFIHKLPVTNPVLGEHIVCEPYLNGHTYTVKRSGDSTSTFQWTVDGGDIVSGAGSDKIVVDWKIEGNRKVSVREVNGFGCVGPEQYITVKVDSLSIEMQYITTGKFNDKQIELYWQAKNTDFFKGHFRIYRQQVGTSRFFLIDSVPAGQTTYTDRNVNTAGYSYRYYIEAGNSCHNTVSTNVHRSILLNDYTVQDTMVRTHWNNYEGWPVVDYYHLFESLNFDTSSIFSDLTKDTTLLMEKSFDGYRQCFRIAGIEGGEQKYITLSNRVCIDLDPILWVPNVFTPDNGDNLNNRWRIVVGNYKAYSLIVYNRWGERIFSSDNPATQWDGTFQGKICPEGVYLYMVKVVGGTKNLYKNGTVNLLR